MNRSAMTAFLAGVCTSLHILTIATSAPEVKALISTRDALGPTAGFG
jgi:hypothetical protein